MKTYIYILFLLAALVQPLLAQDAPATKARPDFPTLPSTVTYTAAPTGGTVKLSVSDGMSSVDVAPGGKIHPNEEVTLTITPTTGATNYKVVFGYPKVYCTKATTKNIKLTPVSGKPDEYTFTMPNEAVTVEVKFEVKAGPSSDARLKALRYKIGDNGGEIPVPDFTPGTKEYTVILPSNTTDGTTIKLSGTVADAYATLPNDPVTTTLASGTGEATLTVTAENGTTADYTVHFVKAEADKRIVTIASVDGGTITVTDAAGKVINSGDVVATGTQLTLTNMPVAGYTFSKYIVGSSDHTGTTVTVDNSDVNISAEFTPPTAPIQPENIGTPAVTEEKPPVPAQDAAVVIVPDAGSLPEDTELWELRLVKENVDESKETKVKETATEAATAAGITVSGNKMVLMEVTLVKVTTTFNGSTGTFETTVTPVQPTDKVKVRIPYPAGVNKNSHDITIIHLKSDGSTEVYSGEDLTLADDYMEITVTGFSPFVVAYVDKPKDPGPDPGPKPDPTYYTVTLPAVEGATTDPAPGNYEVVAWDVFTFYLTLDKDYDQSVPVVTTDRNETITPRTSDGAYIITYVRQPVTISIGGIKKNTDVANETIASGLKIWTEPSALCLDTDRTEEVRIITVAGSTVAAFTAQPGLNRRALAPGLYIVQTARKVSKVIVR